MPVIPAPTPRDLWQRMRAGLAMPGCDSDPRIVPLARRLVGDPKVFEQILSTLRPMIALVQQAVEAAGIPSDFSLLPMVESGYRPNAVGPGNFIGMWQFDRGTARAAGMPLVPGYDGRRDPWVSSVRATRMLARYGHDFGDWRLVVWAFNQGEWGMKRMLAQQGKPPAKPVVPSWPVPASARDYLLRLMAYSCVIREPGRFGLHLPPAVPPAQLWLARLDAPLQPALAAHLAGLPTRTVRLLNNGYLGDRMPAHAPMHLLLPRAVRQRFLDRYAQLPPRQWAEFARYRVQRNDSLQQLLSQLGRASVQRLATINAIEPHTVLVHGATLWLPKATHGLGLARVGGASGMPVWHQVSAGQSLWSLARRYRVTVRELRAWNHLHGNELRVGQLLRLDAPG
jgi:membrane-bound lytic murein transglycosylase D